VAASGRLLAAIALWGGPQPRLTEQALVDSTLSGQRAARAKYPGLPGDGDSDFAPARRPAFVNFTRQPQPAGPRSAG